MLSSDSSDESGMEGEADGFQKVLSKAEKKRRRDAARLSEDSDQDKMQTAKKSHTEQDKSSSKKGDPPRSSRSGTFMNDTSCRSKSLGAAAVFSHSRLSDSESDDEDHLDSQQADGESQEPSRPGRKTLYFPLTSEMDFTQKLQWTLKLCKYHKDFEVLFKDGKYRPYITVKDEHAVHFLTSDGFEGVVMEKPDSAHREKRHKVIIYDVPTCLDPEDLPFDDSFVWVKRREVKQKGVAVPKPQLIALLKESVPEKVFIPCLGYKYVSLYTESPVLCYKCSKWGHMQYKCHNDFRCRFCGKNHDARECVAKMKDNVRIVPSCCNCGGAHNAHSWLCGKRPRVISNKTSDGKVGESTSHVQTVVQGAQQHNVWQQRLEQRQTNQVSEATSLSSQQLGTIPPVGQVPPANETASLQTDIDGLKKMMVDLQKQVVELHKIIMAGVKVDGAAATAVDSAETPVVDGMDSANKSNGNDEVGTVKSAGNGVPQMDGANLLADIGEVEHLVALVRAYVDNPKGKVKSKLLKVASSVGNKIQQNGG